MDLRQLTSKISVAPQIQPEDVVLLAQAGFSTIIDNRPDIEVNGDLGSDAMAKAAAAAGVTFHYLPIVPGQLSSELIDRFARALDAAPGRVLAYCRSGTRSATAWALGQAGQMPAEQIIRAGAEAGYDLSGLSADLR